MLPRRSRLTSEREFQTVYTVGHRRAGRYFLLRFSRGRTSATKVAVVVSTKVSKRAVVRNRLKRQARAVIEELIAKLPPGWNIVVTVRQVVTDRSDWPPYREELRNLFAPPFSG